MKIALTKIAVTMALFVPLTIAAALPASASLNPYEQLPFDQPNLVSVHTATTAAMLERNYFQAPPQQKPVEAKRAAPCTVQMVVFDKARLAQACY